MLCPYTATASTIYSEKGCMLLILSKGNSQVKMDLNIFKSAIVFAFVLFKVSLGELRHS